MTELTAQAASLSEMEAGRHGLRVLATLSTLMGFASISTDLYLPALPRMTEALRSDAGHMELTISGYLIGFSLGQLLWGPIGDRHGRRLPVAIGILLFVVGSAGCALSTSAGEIIGWRVLQAVGACAGVVLSRAMVRDLYTGDRAAQMLSTLITVMAIAPLLGPILGGQILVLASWRAIFWVLVGIGALTLVAVLRLPETLPEGRRNHEPVIQAMAGYFMLIRQKRLLGYAGAGAFLYGGVYAYIAGTPFVYITYYHVPPRFYGLLFAVAIIGIMLANMINARLVTRLGGVRLLRAGTAGSAVAALVVAADAWSGFGGLAGLAIPLFVYISSTGLIVANSIAGAMSAFPHRAGAVSALVGALQYGSGILTSALLGVFADGTPWPMGGVIGLCGLGSLFCAWLAVTSRPARSAG
ncbi:MAG TPA: multidrug effflux MFS transporter [Acidisoma sp.]|uniref:multidrug effflux MFS transporter n=1 Tax=Acidisoma sp. TaxID=1872115 RepID=UPI002C72FD74|nr:multidrug effflux MFS transporter [Acidisoma sp.]HTI00562.1 multidrug effflux MFS transporter [Acidisoma sp.]